MLGPASPARPGSATRTVLGTERREGTPPKGEVAARAQHTAKRPGPGRDVSGSLEGTPETRPLLRHRTRWGAGKRGPGGRRALQGGAPGARGARGDGHRDGHRPLSLPRSRGAAGPPPPQHTPARTGAAPGREGGGRAGWRARGTGHGARGGGPARAAAPAPARKGSRAAAAGVGGGPAPVLAELTGGARFPVPPGVGDPGAVLAVTGGWRAAGPGRRRRQRQGGVGGTGGRWRSRGGRSSLFVFVARWLPASYHVTRTRGRPLQRHRGRRSPCHLALGLRPARRGPPTRPRCTPPPTPGHVDPGVQPPSRARHVTGCPCNLRLGGGVPTSPALSWPSPASSREPAWVRGETAQCRIVPGSPCGFGGNASAQ